MGKLSALLKFFPACPTPSKIAIFLALERMGEMVNTALDHVQNARAEAPLAKAMAAAVEGGHEAPPRNPDRLRVPYDRPAKGMATLPWRRRVWYPRSRRTVAALLDAHMAIKLPGAALEDMAGPKVLSLQERQALNEHGIATCNACGFPVSEGRALCVDCETDSPAEELPRAFRSPAYADPFPEPPADLTFGIDPEDQQLG